MHSSGKPPLVVIAGPTASGKSALALALSRLVPSTLINADASQVYADLRILSARPSLDEEAQAPHRLFGHVDGAEAYSAARWASEAKAAIAEARSDNRLPVIVGGTGLYIRTLLNGIAPVPEIDADVRAMVRALPPLEAHRRLAVADPQAAALLNPADATRNARALEVKLSTGRSLSVWQQALEGGIAGDVQICGMILLPPRDWLRQRCAARFEAMLRAGAADEVKALLARRLDVTLPVMRAIGVREIAAMLTDPAHAATCIEAAQIATRQFAKRQYTWFRNQSPPNWKRIETQLNDESVNKLAIILRDMALTR